MTLQPQIWKLTASADLLLPLQNFVYQYVALLRRSMNNLFFSPECRFWSENSIKIDLKFESEIFHHQITNFKENLSSLLFFLSWKWTKSDTTCILHAFVCDVTAEFGSAPAEKIVNKSRFSRTANIFPFALARYRLPYKNETTGSGPELKKT